jgi:quercetin dioxygenase-like cupin family protein
MEVFVIRCLLRPMLLPTLLLTVSAQQAPVAVEKEPLHHVVIQNEDVIVMRVTVPPGERTLYHIHPRDRAGVQLTANTVTQQPFGQAEPPPETRPVGDLFALADADKPMAHRVHNVGTTSMDVIDVAATPSPSAAGPVAAENPSARIYKWEIAPGKATAMHTHTRPYLIVAVTPMQLKMTAPDGQFRAEQVKAGDLHWVPVPVTHTLANEGSAAGTIVEFELK